jgi:hypothetical protein
MLNTISQINNRLSVIDPPSFDFNPLCQMNPAIQHVFYLTSRGGADFFKTLSTDPYQSCFLAHSFAPDIDLNVEKLIFIGFKEGKLHTTAVWDFIAHLPENLFANKFCSNKTG